MSKAELKKQFLKDDGDWSDCWLCLRTDPHSILEVTHKLIDDPQLAHHIGMKAATLLRDAYLKDHAALSGRKTSALIGAAIYIACRLEGYWYYTQRAVIQALGNVITDPTLRLNYQRILNVMEIELPPKFGRMEA
jgi:transcription initiation factor TFIIIB Brf1 subunit/transcription initiation factor TFIIB